jgi:surface antigen
MSKRIVLALCAALIVSGTPALADGNGGHGQKGSGAYGQYRPHHGHHSRHENRGAGYRQGQTVVVWHAGRHWQPPAKPRRSVRHHVYRPAYAQRHRDDSRAIYVILALQIADVMNDSQRRSYAWAQHRAATAPIGDTIQWNDGGAYGSVSPTREGNDTAGRYCREFQQDIIVGNQRQAGYGIACRQPDGAWEIVS